MKRFAVCYWALRPAGEDMEHLAIDMWSDIEIFEAADETDALKNGMQAALSARPLHAEWQGHGCKAIEIESE